jgi:hypothetical protein
MCINEVLEEPPYATQYFLVLDFIVHFSYYMFRLRLAAMFRWFAKIPYTYLLNGSLEYIVTALDIFCVCELPEDGR